MPLLTCQGPRRKKIPETSTPKKTINSINSIKWFFGVPNAFTEPPNGLEQELQALCLECHRTKTSLEGNHSTTLESRFCRYVYQNYAATPRLPPLVFQLQKWDLDRPCQGIDVCRCRKNGLANARFPLPVFCPLDCIVPAEEGQLADLMWVEMP